MNVSTNNKRKEESMQTSENLMVMPILPNTDDAVIEEMVSEIGRTATIRAAKEDLAAMPLFGGISGEGLEKIASITGKKSFLCGTPIFSQSDPGGTLFLLHKGMVKLTRLIRANQLQILSIHEKGDFFGDVSFISNDKHSTSAVCTTDSEISIISKEDFDKLAQQDPALAIKTFKFISISICSRLRAKTTKVSDMVKYISE